MGQFLPPEARYFVSVTSQKLFSQGKLALCKTLGNRLGRGFRGVFEQCVRSGAPETLKAEPAQPFSLAAPKRDRCGT